MRILITGGRGMLGRTLVRHWQDSHDLLVADLPEVDITRPDSLAAVFDAFRPQLVVHCAAMTNVDACESDRDRAYLLNAQGTANVAQAAAHAGARLFAISTDYVFSGDRSGDRDEGDPTAPNTVHGATKLAGEDAVRALCPDHIIARIAWLYGSGGPSFVHTMVRLAKEDPARTLKVVDDQFGNPTSTDAVADALTAFIARPDLRGTFHLTCEGVVSWCGFTREILRLAGFPNVAVTPCTTEEFPRPAPRPHFSALSKAKLAANNLPPMPPWQDALARFIAAEWPAP